jgi:hypothetical protein
MGRIKRGFGGKRLTLVHGILKTYSWQQEEKLATVKKNIYFEGILLKRGSDHSFFSEFVEVILTAHAR